MKPVTRSRFTVVAERDGIVFLRDDYSDAAPTMTVTNDAEAVCLWCAVYYPGRRIVYRDTEGRWDEIIAQHSGEFGRGKITVSFRPYDGWTP